MRGIKALICTALALILCSCNAGGSPAIPEGTEAVTSFIDPAAPADGGIAVEGKTAGEILDYFSEIAFGSEYGDAPEQLCRWADTIIYKVTGDPTEADLELIGILADRLNGIEHFPGIREAGTLDKANFEVMFVPREQITELFSHATDACIGMSEYRWLTETGEIVSARAAIDSAEEEERASTVCEEFLQALGLAKDSYSHADSVFYQGKCVYTRPSELDWAMIKLLYRPELTPKMSRYEAIKAAAGVLKW